MVWVAHRYIFPALENSLPARVLQLHDATAVPNVLSSAREIAVTFKACQPPNYRRSPRESSPESAGEAGVKRTA